MSARLAPTQRRMPISRARWVTVASMMFMMPMPPTSKRNAGDRPHHDIEDLLRLLALAKEVGRDGDLVVGNPFVAALQDAADDAGRLPSFALIAYLDGDLRDRAFFERQLAGEAETVP